jgi:ABC-2 type transport system permease protein
MFWKITKFEWRMLRAERTALFIVLLFILLTGNALWHSLSGLQRRQRAAQEFVQEHSGIVNRARRAIEENEQQAKAKGEPLEPARIGPRHPLTALIRLSEFQVGLPPLSLAPLGSDQSELYPATYKYRWSDDDFVPSLPTTEARSLGGLLPERPVDNPLKWLLGRFDLGFVVLYLYPLVILALSFNLLAAERESGALALLLSQPIRLRTLVQGKVAVRAALISLVAVLLPALAIYLSQKLIGLETSVVRLLLWMFAVSVSGLFWFGLAVWVNARHHSAARNALTLFVGWMVITILIPALGSLLAQTFFPAPTGAAIAETERAARFETQSSISGRINRITDEMGNRYPIIEGKEETLERYRHALFIDLVEIPTESGILNRFLQQHPEIPRQVTVNQLRQIGRQARNEFIEQTLAPLLALRHRQQQRQQRLLSFFSWLSPALALQKAVSGLAGADRARHERFLDQLDRYIRGLNNRLLPRIYRHESVRAADLETLGAFAFNEETNAQLIRRLLPELALLTALPLLISLFVSRALRRFSVIA